MAEYKIFPHGLPQQLSDGVWWVRGSLAYPLHRNMIVLRLPTGELLLHSVVALDADGMKALEALGKPTYAIVPSTAHAMDIGFYMTRYPNLKVLTPAMYREPIAAKVPLAGTVEDVLPQFGFELHLVPGSRIPEYIYEWPLRTGGCMLMANDSLGSANSGHTEKLMGRVLTKMTGAPGNKLGIARIYRMTMAKDLAAIKSFVAGLADIPDVRIVTVSHGDPVTPDAPAALRAAAAG